MVEEKVYLEPYTNNTCIFSLLNIRSQSNICTINMLLNVTYEKKMQNWFECKAKQNQTSRYAILKVCRKKTLWTRDVNYKNRVWLYVPFNVNFFVVKFCIFSSVIN